MQSRTVQPGLVEIGSAQAGSRQICFGRARTRKIRGREIGAPELRLTKSAAAIGKRRRYR